MIPKSIKMKLPSFLLNFQFFIILSILFLFGLIPIGYSTATGISSSSSSNSNSNEEEHLFRHRHHQHHQQQKQQKQQLLPSSLHHYNNNHRLENVVDDFKKSQDEQKHKNITMINLRHHRTYIVEDVDSNGNSIIDKSTTESPILQFAPLSLDAVSALSTGKNHHLRHHNRHHQVWEQRVFPLLRHHPSTTNIMTAPLSTPPTTTSTDRSFSKKKFHYNFGDGVGRRRTNPPTKTDFMNSSDASNRKLNLTQKTSRYFDHDGFYNWNGFTTTTTRAPSLTKIWQSFDDDNKYFMESSLRTFSDDNRFNLSDNDDDNDDGDDDSSVSEEGNSSNSNNNNEEEEERNKDLIKKNKLQIQQKKNKSNLLNNKKLMNFRNMKKHDEYYEDDDDDDENDENSESIENDNDYNSNENSDDDNDDLNISNESRNYVEQRILPKRKTFNMNSDDIYARSYKPGTLTQQKYEMLGTHEAVKQSRKLHITNQRHHKALATAHITKVTKEAACGIPKPRVERIQRETSKLYVPHCTILHRCGDDTGCCLSDSKTCVAKKTHDVALYFFVKSMNSNQGTIERLTFKNHTECHCVQKSKHNTNNLNLLMEPAMLRRATVLDCNCPKLFEKVLQDDGYCRCDCSSGNSNCDWLKRGMEHFSMVDRKCITEGRCKPPTCEFGSYVKKHGRCPKKDDKMSYSRNLH